MKRIISLLVFLLTGMLFAGQIDVTVSQGTDQSVIKTLYPKPASTEVDANATVKAVFAEALNPMFVQQSARLKRVGKESSKGMFGFSFGKRKKSEDVKGTSTYDDSSHTVTFTPDKPLEPGFYEASFQHLMTKKPGMHMRIKPIVYRFYVPEVINGFKLPPQPDEKKNNETLLGIDFNHNGIRDDVERWVILHYQDKHPVYTEIAFQAARGYQLILEKQPQTREEAKEIMGEVDKALDCQIYFEMDADELGDKILIHEHILNKYFRNEIYFDTQKRHDIFIKYDSLLSGDSYPLATPQEEKDACDFDTRKYEE